MEGEREEMKEEAGQREEEGAGEKQWEREEERKEMLRRQDSMPGVRKYKNPFGILGDMTRCCICEIKWGGIAKMEI